MKSSTPWTARSPRPAYSLLKRSRHTALGCQRLSLLLEPWSLRAARRCCRENSGQRYPIRASADLGVLLLRGRTCARTARVKTAEPPPDGVPAPPRRARRARDRHPATPALSSGRALRPPAARGTRRPARVRARSPSKTSVSPLLLGQGRAGCPALQPFSVGRRDGIRTGSSCPPVIHRPR